MDFESESHSLTDVTRLVQEWENSLNLQNYNSIPTINKIAEILEIEEQNYFNMNIVPFNEQNTNSNSRYHQILNFLLQKNFIMKILNNYLCDVNKFNIAGCRLLLALMPKLDTSKLFQSGPDGLTQRIMKWAGNDSEPLRSYATGILAAAMEVPEIEIEYRDQNGRLVPLMLQRLRELQTSMKSPLVDATDESESKPKRIKLHWDETNLGVEMKLATQQTLILRYLTSMGKCKEFTSHVFAHNALELILWYVNVEETKEVRLGFESLKYLAVLFGHIQFLLDFIYANGLECLLDVPRSSIASPGVSLCLCSLAHCEKAMERVCLLPKITLNNLVKYELWLLESPHDSVRYHGMMFFSITFQFRAILEEFDEEHGLENLRRFILSPRNFNEAMVGHVCVAYKRYFETHLNIKVESRMEKALQQTDFMIPLQRNDKAYKPSLEEIQEQIESLIHSQDYPVRWHHFEQFELSGEITWLLTVIACSTRTETVRNALDVLAIACVNTNVASVLYKEEVVRMNIIFQVADGKCVADHDVQKAALRVIVNCVCVPIDEPFPRSPNSLSEDLLQKIWESVQVNNGSMVLLQLLNAQSPDCIRVLACKALVGLARSERVRDLIFKFNGDELIQTLITSRENRYEHIEFQNYALELLERLCTKSENNFEVTLGNIHKANIIAQTQIHFNEEQLLELTHQYLSKKGLSKTAATLLEEGKDRCTPSPEETEHSNKINLETYITESLRNQHALCKHPMAKCPNFNLFVPHKCPEPLKLESNFAACFARNQMGYESYALNRKFIHSRFCPIQTFTIRSNLKKYTCVRFLPGNQHFLAGLSTGEIRIVKIGKTNEHLSFITHDHSNLWDIKPNRDGTLLLTSAFKMGEGSLSAMWSLNGFTMKLALYSEQYAQFSKTMQDRVIGTRERIATIFDVNTGTPITRLLSNVSGNIHDLDVNECDTRLAVLENERDNLITTVRLYDIGKTVDTEVRQRNQEE